ncbi:MAG: hypothetical protein IKU86_02845 [Thermoguttaceae bacterium]|nr:hypothetical protein [Thermoguttaceae bacterium]
MRNKRNAGLWGVFILLLAVVVGRDNDALTPASVEAQTGATGADVETLRSAIGNFFENLSDPNRGPRKALDELMKNTALGDNEKTTSGLADNLKQISTNFGAYVAYEPVGVKTLGSDLIEFHYLYKCQNHPIVWRFTYYRPRPNSADPASVSWTLLGVRFDSDIDAAFRDVAL